VNLTETAARLAGSPWAAAGGGALLAAAVICVVLVAARRRRRRPGGGRAGETLLTLAVAGLATAMSASGMWKVAGESLGMSGPLRAGVFAFLEATVLVSAIRARRSLREHGTVGVDGAAVWVVAGLSGVLSALDSDDLVEVLLRLAAPLLAAWLWERGLAADRRQAQARRRREGVVWRITRERVLVWLRLAEPTERGIGEVDRARRVARLVRAAWRYHTLRDTKAKARAWRVRWSAVRLRRHALTAGQHLGLGSDDAVRDLVRGHLAALYQVQAGTAPAALTDLSPWTPDRPQDREAEQLRAQLADATARAATADRLAGELDEVRAQLATAQAATAELQGQLDRAVRDRDTATGPTADRTTGSGPVRPDRTADHASPAGPDHPDRTADQPAHRTADQPGDRAAGTADPLLPVAQAIADQLTAAGGELTKRALVDELRKQGRTCGSDRALRLLSALRAGPADQAA
jgi:hypothetical protein